MSSSPKLGLEFVVEVDSLLEVVLSLLEVAQMLKLCTGLAGLRVDVVAPLGDCTVVVGVHTP